MPLAIDYIALLNMIRLNLEDIYDPVSVTKEYEVVTMNFFSPQRDGDDVMMFVELSPHPDGALPGVYNLVLGPKDENGEINDTIRLKHELTDKVFSTAIFFAYVFLLDHPDSSIGVDGSNDTRAMLYHSMFNVNQEHLANYFVLIGVDWYVKLLRNREDVERDENGMILFKPRPEPFDMNRPRRDPYRYYIFELRN